MKKETSVELAQTPDNGGVEVELKRANKLTAYWSGDGIATGSFYKTHEKLVSINSTDEAVIAAGFVMPTGTDEAPVTAQQKLEAYKNFLALNASVFNIAYDPIDRRAEQFKYPSRYDEELLKEFSQKILTDSVSAVLDSVQSNVVEKMIKSEHLVAGTEVKFGIDTNSAVVTIAEAYANGSLKYASVGYPVVLDVNGAQVTVNAEVELVSGQLKKPRQFKESVMTMTGIKTLLVEAGLLPKIEKEVKEAPVTEESAEVTPVAEV